MSGAQKRSDLGNDAAPPHHPGVRGAEDNVITHVVEACARDADLAIAGAANPPGKQWVQGDRTGDDAHFAAGWFCELIGCACGVGSQLQAGRAVDFGVRFPVSQAVHDFTALVGRSEHDNAPRGRGVGVIVKKLT